MGAVRRITFRFADEIEVRYMPDLPNAGDLATHRHDTWTVVSVVDDDVGTVAICERAMPARASSATRTSRQEARRDAGPTETT